MVDRFDLRRHIILDTKVASAIYDEATGHWTVTTSDGREFRTRFLIAATGALSVPYFPDVAGREDFRGEAYHTGLWPATPVDFAGKHVAVVGTGSSGVQIIPEIAGAVASLTVYQRSANWCTPLNNAPISPEEQAQLRAGFEAMREMLNTGPSGFVHPMNDRATFDESNGGTPGALRDAVEQPRFRQAGQQLHRHADRPRRKCRMVRVPRREDPRHRRRPRHGGEADPEGSPLRRQAAAYDAGYYEAFNKPHVALVDLRETPILRMTPNGIETAEGERRFDIIVWATGFDFGTGALLRIDIRGRHGLDLADHWADGPKTYLGVQTSGFPNFFFVGGPHMGSVNTPRYMCDLVDFITDTLVYMRDHGFDTIEADHARRDRMDGDGRRHRRDDPVRR